MVGRTIPCRHFNRPDGALFSVKAAVSKALLFKSDNGKFIYVIFDLTMSYMVRLHLHGLFTCSGVPGGASYETPFTTHQTFAKHVTQIFLCAIKLQKHNFLVTITSTSFLKTF